MDRVVPGHGSPRTVGDCPLMGSPARQRTAAPPPPTLPTRRIRPDRPGSCDLSDLESPPVSVHAANHSRSYSAVGPDWNYVWGRVDRILLPAVDRHSLQPRKNLARLQKSGISRIQHGSSG